MRKILITFLFAILLVSCDFDIHEHEPPKSVITSEHVFVINDSAVVTAFILLPITIYNPNNYAITVTSDGIDYVIAPLATLELKEEGTDD